MSFKLNAVHFLTFGFFNRCATHIRFSLVSYGCAAPGSDQDFGSVEYGLDPDPLSTTPFHDPAPYLAKRLGLDTIWFGYLQTTVGIIQLLGGPVFGRFADLHGARAALTLSSLSSAVYFMILGCATNVPLLFISKLPAVFMHGLPGVQMVVTDLTEPGNRASALSRLGLCFGVGMIVGSSLGGSLSTRYGTEEDLLKNKDRNYKGRGRQPIDIRLSFHLSHVFQEFPTQLRRTEGSVGVLQAHDRAQELWKTKASPPGVLSELTGRLASRVRCSTIRRSSPCQFYLPNPQERQSQCDAAFGIPREDRPLRTARARTCAV
ncbi:UNVERIFIED_CONTAM: hypothetical protein FKN15_017827 [Acipenser sinensis]